MKDDQNSKNYRSGKFVKHGKLDAQKRIREFKAKLNWEDNLDEMRTNKPTKS